MRPMEVPMVKKLGIYIHIPFCKSKCFYCDFYSIVSSEDKIREYLKALIKELKFYAEQLKDKYVIDSIYIGGGTPSLLKPFQIKDLMRNLMDSFKIENGCENSIEVNPESLTEEHLEVFKKNFINRISIGVQTFNNKILKAINRLTDKNEIIKKIHLVKKHGFNNISIDLIFGLPYQSFKDFKKDLKLSVDFQIKHLSLYGLTLNKKTVLYDLYKKQPEIFPDDDQMAEFYKYAVRFLLHHKLKRYEISNFARGNFKCRHNLKYWHYHPTLGLGTASVSTLNRYRWKNIEDIDKYIISMNTDKLKIKKEKISDIQYYNEMIMLKLRLKSGLCMEDLSEKERDMLNSKKGTINEFKKLNLIRERNGHLFLTLKGTLLSNRVISELMIEEN